VIEIKTSDIKGTPVIYLQSDERAGFAKEAVFTDNKKVSGFTVEMDGITFGKKYISMDDILRMDNDSILIFNEHSIKRLPHKMRQKNTGSGCGQPFIGEKVQSRNGKDLGKVKDLVFNSETGFIEGFELSRGLLEDVVDGRNVIMMRDGVEFAEEFIVAEGGEYFEKK
jgi:uncharacterized protein YrrD